LSAASTFSLRTVAGIEDISVAGISSSAATALNDEGLVFAESGDGDDADACWLDTAGVSEEGSVGSEILVLLPFPFMVGRFAAARCMACTC
jgi:hypothetical protein